MPAIYSFPAKSFNCYKVTLWTPSSHNPLNSGWAKSSPSASESLIKQTQKSEQFSGISNFHNCWAGKICPLLLFSVQRTTENCVERNWTDDGALLPRSVKTLSITVNILVLYTSRQTSDGYYRNLCNYTKSLILLSKCRPCTGRISVLHVLPNSSNWEQWKSHSKD